MQKTDWKQLYAEEKPPPFGHELLKYFMLEPGFINLNSGAYGTVPRPVFDACHELNAITEANPDRFHRLHFIHKMKEVRSRLAKLIGAKAHEVVLVPNASLGMYTIMRNFEWQEGDLIVGFSTTYRGVLRTAEYLSDIPPHPTLKVVPLALPLSHAEIIDKFKLFLKENPAAPNRRRVAVIDSIVSNPGVLLPWKELVIICKEENVWSIVDAAHSIGHEVSIDLGKAGPDFWVSNCHKWLFSSRSCAALYVPERNAHIMKASIPVGDAYLSPHFGRGPNIVDQFACNGTVGSAAFLTVGDALDFRTWLGGEEKINDYCHNLAVEGGALLAKILGTEVMESPKSELTLNMVNVRLPLPATLSFTQDTDEKILLKTVEKNIASAYFVHNGAWWTRCSAQVYNDIEDFEIFGQRWLEISKYIIREYNLGTD